MGKEIFTYGDINIEKHKHYHHISVSIYQDFLW